MSRRSFGILLIIPLAFSLSGCASLLFYPDRTMLLTPETLGIKYEDVNLTTPDGVNCRLVLSAQNEPRGTYSSCGNAENISTHSWRRLVA